MTLFLLLLLQGSREVQLSDGPVELRIPVSAPAEHRATVVSFPESSLKALVAGWNEEDLSVERREELLFIKLLRPARGDLHVIGASGRLYRLHITPAEGPYDGQVLLRMIPRADRPFPASLELLRAMRRGRTPPEGIVLGSTAELYRSLTLVASLVYVYDVGRFRGFVIRLRNLSGAPRRIDPSRFTGRKLVVVGSREMLLPPDGETLLYMVFGNEP